MMSVASFGAFASILVAVSTAGASHFLLLLIHSFALLATICFVVVALVRKEFHSSIRDNKRWRRYLTGGFVTGGLALIYTATLPLQEPMLLPPRRITLVHAIAASLVISGCIIRYYVLPLRVAMEAAFYLHEKEHGVILKRLSKSDDPVAQDAAELLQRAEGE